MSLFRRRDGRPLRALCLSLGVHAVLFSVGWFWPKGERDTSPTAAPRSSGLRLEKKRPPSGEESSDAGAGFQSTIKSELLFEPKLTPPAPPVQGPSAASPGAQSLGPVDRGGIPGKGVKTGTARKGATFFQVEAQAKRVVYVLDSSSSMGKDGLWTRASRELMRSLEQLPPDAVFQVIVYHSHAQPLITARPGWLMPDQATLTQVQRALSDRFPEGKTVHGQALNLALAMRPDVVFFLTDADDLPFELLRQVETWNRGKAIIHTFELNVASSLPGTPLQILAQRHGGEYRLVRK